jgi:hypothetical protein
MTKLALSAMAAAAFFVLPNMGFAQAAAPCPSGYLDGGVIVDATGVTQRLCTPDPAAAPPEPVTVDTHGRRNITIAQLQGMMTTFGAVRIATSDLAMGSPEREAVLGAFPALWQFTPGSSTPGLLLGIDTVGAPVFVTGADGSRIGMRVEQVTGGYAVYTFPADDDECIIDDRPDNPGMWSRICDAN